MSVSRHPLGVPDGGYAVSRVISGCWQLADGHRPAPAAAETQSDASLLDALDARADAGFTTFDCADIYTGVESMLGRLVARRRASGKPPIEIHTKWVPDQSRLAELTARDAEQAIDRSLRRLGVERLDLVQFHWWDFAVPGWIDALGWLESLRQAGKLRNIGVTNFDTAHLAPVLEAGVPVVSNQVQVSLLDQRPLVSLVAQAERFDYHLLAYGSLAGGFLTSQWLDRPEPAAPLANRSLVKYRLIIDEAGGWAPYQTVLRAVADIATAHGTSAAAVASAWVLAQPRVAAAIVGVRDDRHIEDHRRAASLSLSADDHARLRAAMKGLRPVAGEVYALEREIDGRHAVIMKTELHG